MVSKVGGTEVQPTVALITTYPILLVGLVNNTGRIVSAFVPEPLIVVIPTTFTVSSIVHVIKYPGMVETIKIESDNSPEQITGLIGVMFTIAVGLITRSCIMESIPHPLAVYTHM